MSRYVTEAVAGRAAHLPPGLRRPGVRQGVLDLAQRPRPDRGQGSRRARAGQLAARRSSATSSRRSASSRPSRSRRSSTPTGRSCSPRSSSRSRPRLAFKLPKTEVKLDRRTPASRTRGAPPAERAARGQRDGGPARRGRLQRVLRRVRVPRRQVRARTRRDLRRRQADSFGNIIAPMLRGYAREEVMLSGALLGSAIVTVLGALLGGTFGVRHRRAVRSRSGPPPGSWGSTASCSATGPTPSAGARSRCSRRASRSSGCSARSSA